MVFLLVDWWIEHPPCFHGLFLASEQKAPPMENRTIRLIDISEDEFKDWMKCICINCPLKNLIKSGVIDEEIMSREEVMEFFHITDPTLRKWYKKGYVPYPMRKGNRVIYNKKEIMNSVIPPTEMKKMARTKK
jgi:predicted DNA-binding transcriptional regulator AlpA